MLGYLILADGTVMQGQAFGWQGQLWGRAVFNTGMMSYQSVIQDPVNYGQIVIMTWPLIGNIGIAQAEKPAGGVRGLVVKEYYDTPDHWRCQRTLDQYMKQQKIIGLAGVDTRYLMRLLRDKGAMGAVILSTEQKLSGEQWQELVKLAQNGSLEQQPVMAVTCKQKYQLPGSGPDVAVLDLGAAVPALGELQGLGCSVTVFPAQTKAEEIIAASPDGLLISDGPGSPDELTEIVQMLKSIMQAEEKRLPIFGVGLGHNVLASAMGAANVQLKSGHHGTNQPVLNIAADHVCITSQNHSWTVDEKSLDGLNAEITRRNINDQTIEGLCYLNYPAFSVQYQPQVIAASPDSEELYRKFADSLQGAQSSVGGEC